MVSSEVARIDAAKRVADCPSCKAPRGRMCKTPRGRHTRPHAPRLALADKAAAEAGTCTATSRRGERCDLPALAEFHHGGHEARTGPASSVIWPVTDAEREGWAS